MKLKVKTAYNANEFARYYETNSLPSQTVPDQTIPLKTLLDRYAKGLPLSGNPGQPIYHGEEEMPDLSRMDISEIHNLQKAVKSDIQEKQQILAEHDKAAAKAAHEKSINDEVEKRVKSKKSDKSDEQSPK